MVYPFADHFFGQQAGQSVSCVKSVFKDTRFVSQLSFFMQIVRHNLLPDAGFTRNPVNRKRGIFSFGKEIKQL